VRGFFWGRTIYQTKKTKYRHAKKSIKEGGEERQSANGWCSKSRRGKGEERIRKQARSLRRIDVGNHRRRSQTELARQRRVGSRGNRTLSKNNNKKEGKKSGNSISKSCGPQSRKGRTARKRKGKKIEEGKTMRRPETSSGVKLEPKRKEGLERPFLLSGSA